MGQVWSKADFDGTNPAGFSGGRGSVLAVTAQNSGPDGQWDTADDITTPLNQSPAQISIDTSLDATNNNPNDRVRGFNSAHGQGVVFSFGDGSTHFIQESINPRTLRNMGAMADGQVLQQF